VQAHHVLLLSFPQDLPFLDGLNDPITVHVVDHLVTNLKILSQRGPISLLAHPEEGPYSDYSTLPASRCQFARPPLGRARPARPASAARGSLDTLAGPSL